MKLFIFFILYIPLLCLGSEQVDSFIIRFHPHKVIVLSPRHINANLSVIVENKTLSKIFAQIITKEEKIIYSFTIRPNGNISMPLKISKSDEIFLMPLSPAFQAVPLKIGSRPYEIPQRERE